MPNASKSWNDRSPNFNGSSTTGGGSRLRKSGASDTQDRLDESQKKLEAILAIDRELRRGNKGSE